MTDRGRPTTGTPVEVRIPDDLLTRIDSWAATWDSSRAFAIRVLLGLGLDFLATPCPNGGSTDS